MKRSSLLILALLMLVAGILRIDSHHQVAHSQSTSGITVPLYRLHNYSTDQYIVTVSSTERDAFIRQGWTYEKNIGYVYTSSDSVPGLLPLYRLQINNIYTLTLVSSVPAPNSTQIILGYVFLNSNGSNQPLWQANNQSENSYFAMSDINEYNNRLPSGWHQAGVLCYLPSSTTTGNPGWPKQLGTVGDESVERILIDHSGSVYIVGSSAGSLFGTNTGNSNCFAAKYDTDGNFLWGKQFGASATDLPASACIDSSNNLYVVGATDGNLFGTSAGDTDAFVTKLSPDGATLWSKQFGTSTTDFANDVAVDAQNNVYVVGETVGGLFGPISGVERLQGAGSDAYIVEYDASGNQLWSKQFGDGEISSANRIRFDNASNFYVAGGTGSLFGPNVTGYDAYVAKYSPSKTLLWGKQFGSVNLGDRTDPNGLCIDASDNVYVAGATNRHDNIDGNPDTGDGYITKFDTNGNSLWTQQWATAADDSVEDLGLDSQGNVYAVGQTAGSLFASFTGSDNNGVIAKYDTNGNLISGVQYGAYTGLEAIALDTQDRLYLAGGTSVSLFGPCAGGEDIFVQRLNSSGQMAKAIRAQFPKTKPFVDALGVRVAAAEHPVKNVVQCAWAGKIVTLNHPSILVNNHPYMYIGYTGIATRHSRIASGKGEHKEVAVTSPERQVVVRYGSSSFSLNGKTSKMSGKPISIGNECYVPLAVVQAAVPIPIRYDTKAKLIAFDPPQLVMRKRLTHKV